jgi:hypothetical protein
MIGIMKWSIFAACAAVALSGGTALADDDIKSLVADCGGPDVKADDIDSCLERARELGETNPSPQLQGLTARLERMAERGDDDNDLSKTYMTSHPTEPAAGDGGAATPAASTAAPHAEMH